MKLIRVKHSVRTEWSNRPDVKAVALDNLRSITFTKFNARQLVTTTLLVTCALLSFSFFLYQSGEGQLTAIFGKPALPTGTPVLSFTKKAISKVSIKTQGQTTTYSRQYSFWSIVDSDPLVRADYRKLDQLLFLAETATILEELSDTTLTESPQQSLITLTADTGETYTLHLLSRLPRYTGIDPVLPTFAIAHPDGRIYSCTSELEPQLPNLLDLKDHRPFFFHPDLLSTISYKSNAQTITLTRPTPQAEWIITSPLKLRTDPAAVNKLISSLYTLEASSLEPRSSITKQSGNTLTLASFSSAIPPQELTFNAVTKGIATTNDQPFRYNISPQDIAAILPDLNQLRTKKLAQFSVADISSILLQSRYQPYPVTLAIRRTQMGNPRWMYETSGQWKPASEAGVADLLTALTKDPVSGFSLDPLPSDQESDKSVTVLLKDGTKAHFDLVQSGSHTLIQRAGDTYAAKLSSQHALKIQTTPTAWKDRTLWNLSAIDLRGFQRQIRGRETESYSYNFTLEEWRAQVNGQNVTDDLDQVSANSFLNYLEGFSVARWIPAYDPFVKNNASSPMAQLITLTERLDDFGDRIGVDTMTLTLFPVGKRSPFTLIRLDTNAQPPQFALIDQKQTTRLLMPLLFEN